MLVSILASMSSLMWGSLLLTFVMFIFGIAIMQSLLVFQENSGRTGVPADILENYGSVGKSMVTLFKAVSGGKDWDDLVVPLLEVSEVYTIFYVMYILVVVFGVMNVLTAVFCENATHISAVDKNLVIQEEVDRDREDLEALTHLMGYADEEKSGRITRYALEKFLSVPERRAMMRLVAVDASEALGLFDMLDVNHGEGVDLSDYIHSLMRLKGASKGCDTAMLLFETRRMMMRLASFMCYTTDSFQVLFNELHLDGGVQLKHYVDQAFLIKQEQDAKVAIKSGFMSQVHREKFVDALQSERKASSLKSSPRASEA